MPTLVTRYVDTRSPAGGNGTTPSTGSGDANRAYPNLSASLAATSASFPDLVAADIILKIECAGGLDTSSNTSYNLNYNTDYDRYLWIAANSSSRSNGVWDGSKYTIANNGNNARVISIDNIRAVKFEGLQIENRATNGIWSVINSVASTPDDRQIQIIDCYLRSITGSGNAGQGISVSSVLRKSLVVANSIIHGGFETAIRLSFAASGSRPSSIYNNTIFGAGAFGIGLTSTTAPTTNSIYNNIVIMSGSNTTAYATSSGIPLFTGNNISSDNTSPQTNLRNINVQFVNTASGDFRLVDRFSPAVNVGTDLSNDIIYPFSADIAGNIRGTGRGGRVWDIGALEYQRPPNIIVRNIDNPSNILFQDDFNRADGPIGSNYQTASGSFGFEVNSSTARVTGSALPSRPHLSCVSTASILFPDDQEVQVTFTNVNPGGFDFCGQGVRIDPTNATGYILRMDGFNSNGRGLHRINGTSLTQIGGVNLAQAVGQTWTLRAQGNRISVYRDGVVVLSVIDNTYTSGQPGLFYDWQNSRGTRMDNFIVRSLRNTATITSTGNRGRVISSNTWG